MKMTKKLFLVAIATAAFALTGCSLLGAMGGGKQTFDNDEADKDKGTKKNLTIGYRNLGNSKLYKRVWKQLGTKETVQSLQTVISIDMSKVQGVASSDDNETWVAGAGANQRNTRAVVGLIFDLHETKTKDVDDETGKKVTKKFYDFVLIGYRPATKGFYVEKYTDVPEDAFDAASNDSSFSDAEGIGVEYIPSTTGKVTSATKFYIGNDNQGNVVAEDGVDTTLIETVNAPLGKGEDESLFKTKAEAVEQQQFTVTITQETPGTYNINLLGLDFVYTPEKTEDTPKKWYNTKGYRIGGAGYYVNVPVDTEVAANFNSKNDITKGLEEEVEE
jgi:hypothetical protein